MKIFQTLCYLTLWLSASAVPAQPYWDMRPAATARLDARDHGPVLKHGPEDYDKLGARDVWVYEDNGKYYMHYDAAGPTGWLVALAESTDLVNWTKKGTMLDLGSSGTMDSASASYGTTYRDDAGKWHMFYLGTPNVTPAPNLIPAFPYTTMKAEATSPSGPWKKRYDITPFSPAPGTYYSDTASPGFIVKNGDEYMQFLSVAAKVGNYTRRSIGVARTKNLDSPWTMDPHPIVPLEEQIENSTMYYEPSNQTWFLFTNHIGVLPGGAEYTDAVWVYWTKDLNHWDARHKAVVLDGTNCNWASRCIGLPSVVKHGDKLGLFYDAPKGDSTSHMARDIGLAWLDLPLVPPDAGLPGKNPHVVEGANILPAALGVVVSPGKVIVDGKTVDVITSGITVAPGTTARVTDEKHQLSATPAHAWMPGVGALEKLKTANMIPGALIPGSVHVTANGETLTVGKDYTLDETWGKIGLAAGSSVSTQTPVMVDYTYGLLRVDGIDILPDGTPTLVEGEPHFVCPVPAPVTTGALRLANIYRPYNSTKVESWHIFIVGEPLARPTLAQTAENVKPVRNTLEKLRTGKPVTIVTWGDSVTAGGDTTRPELAFANLFISRLKERFPTSEIKHVNAAIGGSNTDQRLPNLQKEVLDHKPDLVTIEFVNDERYPAAKIQDNWGRAIKQIKAAGAEAVVITPHFTVPSFMGNALPRGTETREAVRWMKMAARENGAALADTSRRWEHLESEGIPYMTLLWNGINHPNDAGHELFVRDLMNLFPATEQKLQQ